MVDSKDCQQIVGGKKRPTSKLRPRYDGPYRVVRCQNDGRNFTLQLNEDDNSHPVFHISKLKNFRQESQDEEGGQVLREMGLQK